MAYSKMAVITFFESGESPDNTLPTPPVYPGHALPGGGGGRPDNSLPPFAVQLPVYPFDPTLPDRPDNSLPGSGGSPDNSLPGSGARPDNGLPVPGKRYVIKYLKCAGLILVPDNSLPGGGAEPK